MVKGWSKAVNYIFWCCFAAFRTLEVLKLFMTWQDGTLHGENLCNFFRAPAGSGPGIPDEIFSAVRDKLMDREGYLFNRLQIADRRQSRYRPGGQSLPWSNIIGIESVFESVLGDD